MPLHLYTDLLLRAQIEAANFKEEMRTLRSQNRMPVDQRYDEYPNSSSIHFAGSGHFVNFILLRALRSHTTSLPTTVSAQILIEFMDFLRLRPAWYSVTALKHDSHIKPNSRHTMVYKALKDIRIYFNQSVDAFPAVQERLRTLAKAAKICTTHKQALQGPQFRTLLVFLLSPLTATLPVYQTALHPSEFCNTLTVMYVLTSINALRFNEIGMTVTGTINNLRVARYDSNSLTGFRLKRRFRNVTSISDLEYYNSTRTIALATLTPRSRLDGLDITWASAVPTKGDPWAGYDRTVSIWDTQILPGHQLLTMFRQHLAYMRTHNCANSGDYVFGYIDTNSTFRPITLSIYNNFLSSMALIALDRPNVTSGCQRKGGRNLFAELLQKEQEVDGAVRPILRWKSSIAESPAYKQPAREAFFGASSKAVELITMAHDSASSSESSADTDDEEQ